MRYRALPAFRWAKASLTCDSKNSSVTGVMPWRLQKSSIVLIVAGLPMGDPPTDFSPEINGNTSIFTDGTAPTICNVPPGRSVLRYEFQSSSTFVVTSTISNLFTEYFKELGSFEFKK